MGNTKSTKQYYLNNPNIPAKNAELEGTEEEWIFRAKEIKKCKKDIFYFVKKYIYVLNPDRGRDLVKLYDYQKRMLKKIVENRFTIFNTSRQIGKSMLISIYAVWYLCFSEDKSILLSADKEATAIEIFGKVKLAYEQLPNWIKPGAIEFSKTKMLFDNGCKMQVTTTTENTGRGFSINVLLLDEFAFVDSGTARSFFTSVLPTISASKTSKVIITSTPNGVGNLFYELFTGAVEGKNSYAWDTVLWSDVPGRTEEFRKDQISQMGYKKFAQEYEAQFISDANSFIPEELFQQYRIDSKPPLIILDEGKYKIWKEYNKDHIYVIGVDVGEGVGRDRSNIAVFDITNLAAIEQVATFSSDDIGPYNFTSKCYEIACQWGSPHMLIERNNQGGQVVDGLFNKYHYPNLISYGASELNRKSNIIGILSHTNVKMKAITNFRYWLVERQCIKLNDIASIEQFKEFVQYPNGTWAAIKGDNHHDDYIMSMIWALFILQDGIVENLFNIIETDANKKPLIIAQNKDYQNSNLPSSIGYNDNIMPVFFGGYSPDGEIEGMKDLFDMGFKPYQPGRNF